MRRRLAIRQVDDADLVALPSQPRQRAAARNFRVVGMRPDGDHIQGRKILNVHGSLPPHSSRADGSARGGDRRLVV